MNSCAADDQRLLVGEQQRACPRARPPGTAGRPAAPTMAAITWSTSGMRGELLERLRAGEHFGREAGGLHARAQRVGGTSMLYKVTSAHEEGGERVYSVSTTHFEGDEDGNVQWLHLVEVEFVDGKLTQQSGTERKIPAQLVTLAMGFTGTDQENGVGFSQFGLDLDERGNIARDADFEADQRPLGVYVAGDAGRGQSLIVWAIAEGRSAARGVDRFLTGESELPAPIRPTDRSLMV